MDALEIEYKNRNPSGYWFEPDTMKFFKSRIGEVRQIGQIWLFVSSEKSPPNPRGYTVRRMDEKGQISDVTPFMSHNRSTVRSALRRAVTAEKERQSNATVPSER
jgi:hypothetical protein